MTVCAVIDTNVLIVASAADDGSPFRPEATPVEEYRLRKVVLDWVTELKSDSSRNIVLDWDWHICGEYQKKLNQEQDFGFLAVIAKIDRNEVTWIGLEVDSDGHAVLPIDLSRSITDLEDRKMAAGVLKANNDGNDCKLVNACDTDWIDCEAALAAAGLEVEHLIEDWLRLKHHSMKAGN